MEKEQAKRLSAEVERIASESKSKEDIRHERQLCATKISKSNEKLQRERRGHDAVLSHQEEKWRKALEHNDSKLMKDRVANEDR